MDLPEVVGRQFGCMHKEEHNLMLPKDAHPFRHMGLSETLFWGPYNKDPILFMVLYYGPLFSETPACSSLRGLS